MFAQNQYSVFDRTTKAEVDSGCCLDGKRSGFTIAASVTLPIFATDKVSDMECWLAVFGGGSQDDQDISIKTVGKMEIIKGRNEWVMDDDMPYARVQSDAVIQPNGKILIFNGARHGRTGGGTGNPIQYGTAADAFLYDPEAPKG